MDMVVRREALHQIPQRVGAVEVLGAVDEEVVGFPVVGEDEQGGAKGADEDLDEGRVEGPHGGLDVGYECSACVSDVGGHGRDVAEEAGRGGGIVGDAGDGFGESEAV